MYFEYVIVSMSGMILLMGAVIAMLMMELRNRDRRLEFECRRLLELDGRWRRNYLSMASMVKAQTAYDAAAADSLRGPPEPQPELDPAPEDQGADDAYQEQFGENGEWATRDPSKEFSV